jgi:hypothetical protein
MNTRIPLGKIEFPNSCSPAGHEKFLRGVAMLHSFYYSAAQKAFEEVAVEDNSSRLPPGATRRS